MSYNFDFHLYTKPCFKYGTYTQDYILTYVYITFYILLSFLSDDMSQLKQHTRQDFYGDGDKHIDVTAGFTLKAVEHVHSVINGYIKEDVRLNGTIYELIVNSSTVVIDSSDIINDQVNELDVFIGEMEDEHGEGKRMKDECSS